MKKTIHKFLNKLGYQLIKPELIHNNGGIPGGTVFSRRLSIFKSIYKELQNVEGDIIELGVHWGYGVLLHHHCKKENQTIIGFDSFAGHSKPTSNDLQGGRFRNFSNSFAITESDVYTTMEYGLNVKFDEAKKMVVLKKGFVQDTLPEFVQSYLDKNKKVALVHCDMDIYEPFLIGLKNTWKILNKNGIIIIGKLDNPELMGKTIAFKEFLSDLHEDHYKVRHIDMIELGTSEMCKLTFLQKNI